MKKEALILSIAVITMILISAYAIQIEKFRDKNCVDASKECQEFFSKLGIESRMTYGSRWEEGTRICHCWLEVDTLLGTKEFECTLLEFKDISSRYKIDWREE